jgi:hypothetical protein
MHIIERQKIYTPHDIGNIESQLLKRVLASATPDAVEACISYARFLNLTGITNENYPMFVQVLEVGNHWAIDALIGERDPFLFLSSIQPNFEILASFFSLLTERHPGGLYAKALSVILGVMQTTYNVPEDGYKIYAPSISDINALGKHLDEEIGQEDSLNRVILDILEKVSKLQGSLGTEALSGPTRVKEELAIHADEIRSFFFDETKKLNQVIPQVLLVRMDFRKLEIHPRNIISFEESKLYETENAGLDPYAEVGDEEYGDEEYEEEEYEEEEYEEEEEEEEEAAADDEELEPDPA